MKKIGVMVIVVVLLAGGGFVFWNMRTTAPAPPMEVVENPTPTPEEMAQWNDPAGLAFSYPKALKVNPHEEDNENYAHVELTHPDNPGRIIVWAKDTTAKDARTWVKNEKTLADGVALDTTLAGQPGQKVLVSTPKKRIITVTLDEGIAFYVEGEFDNSEYWTQVYDTIVSTFAFIPLEGETISSGPAASAQGEGEISVDEEEVLE